MPKANPLVRATPSISIELSSSDTITALPTANDANAMVLKLTSTYVQVEDARKLYDWAVFLSLVTSRTDNDITLEDSHLGHAIISSQSTVQDMVENILVFVSNDTAVPPQHLGMISKKIEGALTDLKTTHSKGFAEPKKSDSTHSTWEYRPLLSFPYPHRCSVGARERATKRKNVCVREQEPNQRRSRSLRGCVDSVD
jgi:hypothetical protein